MDGMLNNRIATGTAAHSTVSEALVAETNPPDGESSKRKEARRFLFHPEVMS